MITTIDRIFRYNKTNRLIALFMGAVEDNESADLHFKIPPVRNFDCVLAPSHLRYESDWNWLMPVVHKINEVYNQADGELLAALINTSHYIYTLHICGPELSVVYDAVVEFIEWFNDFLSLDYDE